MFRAHDDQEKPSDYSSFWNYDEQLQPGAMYPNLDSSLMMRASVLMIQDEGFDPIIEEQVTEEELEVTELTPQPISNQMNSFKSVNRNVNNGQVEGLLNDVLLTPRSHDGSNRSSRSNSVSSHMKRGYFGSNISDTYEMSGLVTPKWDIHVEDDIDLTYASGSSCGESDDFERSYKESIRERSEIDLGFASCREVVQDWKKFYDLRNFLSDVSILNKIMSFVYYPNFENIMKSNELKTNDIANMLKSILRLRLVNTRWKQSIDNPTGVLYHYLLEYSSIQKSISLKNLEFKHSEFNFFSVPGIYMVGIGQIIGKTSLIPLALSSKAYTQVEQDYGPAAANTVLALGAGITIASGSFALFMLSGAFYLLPIAAGGYVLDKAIEFGMDYSNKKDAEKQIIQSVEEKEKALDMFRMKMRKITRFESIEIVNHEQVEEQGADASFSGYLLSYSSLKNRHSVNYVIRVTMVIDQSTYSYTIKKRYSQFEKLFQRMCLIRKTDKITYQGELLVFPEKERLDTLFGWRSSEIVATRSKIFNKLLQELVLNLETYKDDESIMVFLTDSEDQK